MRPTPPAVALALVLPFAGGCTPPDEAPTAAPSPGTTAIGAV